MPEAIDDSRLEYELRGKTLKVYLYILNKGGPVGVREVQRALNFSSPSVAHHHIEKLVSLGILSKDEYGRYILMRQVDVGILQAFTKIGRFTLPRLGFYAAFFTTLTIGYIIQSFESLNIYALGFALAGTVIFWYEAFRVWRRKPF